MHDDWKVISRNKILGQEDPKSDWCHFWRADNCKYCKDYGTYERIQYVRTYLYACMYN